ncbi:hypothetical protein [Photobacterium sp. R1]
MVLGRKVFRESDTSLFKSDKEMVAGGRLIAATGEADIQGTAEPGAFKTG